MTTSKNVEAPDSDTGAPLRSGKPDSTSGELQRGQTGTSDQDGDGSDLGDQGGDSQARKRPDASE